MPLPLCDPVDRVELALRAAMAALDIQDMDLFLITLRALRHELDAAYHEAGAPYGLSNGWGMFRWTEECVNAIEYDTGGVALGA